jgi:glutaredoxin
MTDYSLKMILLEGCPYSISASKLLKSFNIKNNEIWINQENKEKYKTDKISTFPQIYLTKKNKIGNLLIGGYSDLKYLFDLVYKKNYNSETVNIIRNKYNYSKKTTLRVIQLINNIN